MKSIRGHLTRVLCLAIGALLVLAGFSIFFAARGVMTSQFDDTLTAKARALITAAEIDDGDFEIDLTVQDFAGFGTGGDYFEIRREGGRRLMRSPSLARQETGLGEVAVPAGFDPVIRSGQLEDGSSARFFVQRFVPKDDGRRRFQDLHLVVASPTRDLHLNFLGLALVLVVAGSATLLLTIGVIRIVLERGLRPLDHVTRQVQEIRIDQLDQRVDDAGLPAELQPLVRRLNGSLARLGESFQRERRFSSNAAHELRTPLAELKTLAELGATWPEEANPSRCAEMLAVIGELETLLGKLSLLARADAGRLPVSLEEVNLAASVDAAVDRIHAKAGERGIRFKIDAEAASFRTDPVLWNAILGNLTGNAAAYAPAGSTVEIHASPSRFTIENPAPALETEDLDRLFERFWRKDEARAGSEHSGLGLSIVRACAGLLGGECSARLSEDKRFRVEIAWPLR